MARSTNRASIKDKIFVILAYKDNKRCGYLFWQKQLNSPKTLRVAHPASSNIATWRTEQAAKRALNERMPDRLITIEDNLKSEGYDLEIVNFG